MYNKILNITLCFLILLFLTSCENKTVKESKDFEGKIYFESNRFGGESYKVNTGTCYYDGKKVHKLYKDKWNPQVSRDGNKLAFLEVVNGKMITGKLSIMDLSSKKTNHYNLPLVILKYKWMPDNKKIGVTGRGIEDVKNRICNIYIFNPETNELKKVTNNEIPNITINSFSFSPGSKNLVYGIRRTQNARDGRIIKIVNLETGEEREIPFSSIIVAWAPDGRTIAMTGTYYKPDGTRDVGNKVMLYDLNSDKFKISPKDGGKNAYQWEEELCYSPDGKKIAFIRVENSGAKTLWMMDADGDNRVPLVYDGHQIDSISWGE